MKDKFVLLTLLFLSFKSFGQDLIHCKLNLDSLFPKEKLGIKANPKLSEMKINDTIYLINSKVNELSRQGIFFNLKYFRDINEEDLKSDNQMRNADLLYRNELASEVKDFVYKETYLCKSKKLYEFVADTTQFADWVVITDNNIKINDFHSVEFLTNSFAKWVGSNKTNNLLKQGVEKVDLYKLVNQPLVVENNFSYSDAGCVCFRLQNGNRLCVAYINKNPNVFSNPQNKIRQDEFINSFNFKGNVVYDNDELFYFENDYYIIYEIISLTFNSDKPCLITNVKNGISKKIIKSNFLLPLNTEENNFYEPTCFYPIWKKEKLSYLQSIKQNSRNIVLHKGPKGGCYYISESKNKIYVDRSLCR